MKKIILLILLIISFSSFSQRDSTRLNAISIGAKTAFGPSIELSFERKLSKHFNIEFFVGVGSLTNLNYVTGYVPNVTMYRGGGNIELYINGIKENKMRFQLIAGPQVGYGQTRPLYNYENQATIISSDFLIGFGISYFGKKGFNFKLSNAAGLSYNIITYDEENPYYDVYGNNYPNNQNRTHNVTNIIFKPNIRLGYRF